jgi:type IV pilus assembly protein PilN
MANINLLPWREWERERKRKEFLVQIGAVFVVGILAVLGGGLMLDDLVDTQKGRNEFLQSKITGLDETDRRDSRSAQSARRFARANARHSRITG